LSKSKARTVSAYDSKRAEAEMLRYHESLDSICDNVYRIAADARKKGLDMTDVVEIPRASDLAGRCEKLLETYLDGLEIADDIREKLGQQSREIASIQMGTEVAKRLMEKNGDLQASIDAGLRVGLAILTEAILVAPLEGIGRVQLLNNVDGSTFLSIDFCGPIRAAGGTAQALAVLIGDMIRREMGLSKYEPTTPEVERVKEEFGLYRSGLQYRPSPTEIETIVRSCPVMVNGEGTERIECSGYREVRNIDDARVRGGVLLVIGEGLCLKAPKIQRIVDELGVPGWEWIAHFAAKGKQDEGGQGGVFKPRAVKQNDRYMSDIIAGRPVFGQPSEPGSLRLRYGRTRASGLAAAGMNPTTMFAMGGFLAVGTQMKIERPGKACAVTPCDDIDGPSILLADGRFGRIDEVESWLALEGRVVSIRDAGELVIGYGEFLENNKNLLPSAYNSDWFASDLLRGLDSEVAIEEFASIISVERSSLPEGVPNITPPETSDSEVDVALSAAWRCRDWHRELRRIVIDWSAVNELFERFGTAVPPPWNLMWSDLPLELVPQLIETLTEATIEEVRKEATEDQSANLLKPAMMMRQMRLCGTAKKWKKPARIIGSVPEKDRKARPEKKLIQREIIVKQTSQRELPGTCKSPPSLRGKWPWSLGIEDHGVIKSALMALGIRHRHDREDIIIEHGWPALLDGFGLFVKDGENQVSQRADGTTIAREQIAALASALVTVREEERRVETLDEKRSTARIASETAARQRGETIEATELEGNSTADTIPDPGPTDPPSLHAALNLLDDDSVDGALWLVRRVSQLRWEDAAPNRIGSRMGRPEKAAGRQMKPPPHALFPIDNEGGPQRLLNVAAAQGSIRVQLGRRRCIDCNLESPFIRCHHRPNPELIEECGGRTEVVKEQNDHLRRRLGQLTTVPLKDILEVKRKDLGLDRLPARIKSLKTLTSKAQIPEPLEKGILRAHHELFTFKDGTIRFDMIDVPVTHFRPIEIGTSCERLVELGYTHDVRGEPLTSKEQVLELYPQDFIPSLEGEKQLVQSCIFIDDLLIRYYGMEPYYLVESKEDLVGHLGIALAPHTSGGVLCRIIGWTKASAGYAHTLFHAAKRRNADGDEDCLMLLLDGLLNFSRLILPATRGGQMDAPLTLTTRLNPMELDKEALNVDAGWYYPAAFYEKTLQQPHPKSVQELVDTVENRLESVGSLRGYGYTHELSALDSGPTNSAYKTLGSMIDKMNAQLELCQTLRAVDVRRVASQVIESHFLPDLRGNLVAFTRQKFRCVRCGASYRRLPLAGKCITETARRGGLHGARDGERDRCGNKLVLTVSEGAVRKYIHVMQYVIDTFGTDDYTRQRFEWLTDSVEGLFGNDKVTVFTLDDFL
jgi:hypothetical protein